MFRPPTGGVRFTDVLVEKDDLRALLSYAENYLEERGEDNVFVKLNGTVDLVARIRELVA